MGNAVIGTLMFTSVSVISFIISIFVQFKIYKVTEKKLNLFIIPTTFGIASIITFLLSYNVWFFLLPIFVGAPITVGGIVGVMFAVKYR